MIEIFDRNRVKQAILQNAFDIEEDLQINSLYTLTFSLPYDDPKTAFCRPFWMARHNGRLYRIQPSALEISDAGAITYTCEHVIATLIDKALFGYYHIGGLGVHTAEVLRWLLTFQSDWRLGQCDFFRQFEYGWEQETLLAAFHSVPARFTEPYIWEYDTESYPWIVHLKKLDLNGRPQLYIRNEKNVLQLHRESDTREICTRLYPLGYGEGVNQLGIKEVNSGVPYLQSPPEYIERYGIVERIWIDRRYEDAESLKQAAQVMLDQLQEPIEEYEVSFAELDGGDFDKAALGKVVQITDTRLGLLKTSYVTGITRREDSVAESTLTIANKAKDIAGTVAEMADRQRIEAAYAQGATQIYSHSLQVNADAKSGAILDFSIPSEMRIVNKVLAKIRMESFRAYSKATDGGGSVTQTSGASSSSTTSSGGGGSTTSEASSITTTKSGGGATTTSMEQTRKPTSSTESAEVPSKNSGSHYHFYTNNVANHTHDTPGHAHGMSHTHKVSMSSHSHGMSHTHTVTVPGHAHAITPGIYRFGSPKGFTLFVNGAQKEIFNETTAELDLTPYLLDDTGKIRRGSFQSIEVRPDDLAYISIVLYVQGFVQSRGDMTV